MNVLHLALSLERGGRREAILTLARLHRKDGIRSLVGTVNQLGCAPAWVEREFVGYIELARRGLVDSDALRRLVTYCARQRIDVIHAHDAASQLYAIVARLVRPRTGVLMTFHRSLGFESARPRDRFRNFLAGLVCQAVVVGSSERQRHYLSENQVRRSKVIRIPFGVDTERFVPDRNVRSQLRNEMGWGENTWVVGAVGHFGQEKGIDLVILAFQQLARRTPSLDCRLLVLGDGSLLDRQRVERLAGEMLPSGKIVLAGFREDVPRWLNGMDLFVHAPRQEAFGLVVAEAMAAGLPVVATRTGGVPDMIRHGQTGLLVAAERPAELAEAIMQLADNPGLCRRLSREARRVVQVEFSADRYAQRYSALYRHLVKGGRPKDFDPEAATARMDAGKRVSATIDDSVWQPSSNHEPGGSTSCLPK